MIGSEINPHDLTHLINTEAQSRDFVFVNAAAALGNASLRLLGQHGYPSALRMDYSNADHYPDPSEWRFWAPPGSVPILKAEKVPDGSYDFAAYLPRPGEAAPTMNAAAYNVLLPGEPGYFGARTKITGAGRTFYAVQGGRERRPTMRELKASAAINSVTLAIEALTSGKPPLNGEYRFVAISG